MKSLKKRIDNIELYQNSDEYKARVLKTIRSADRPLTSERMTTTLDNTKSTRTSDKIKTSI
jgi:hypothetical protein